MNDNFSRIRRSAATTARCGASPPGQFGMGKSGMGTDFRRGRMGGAALDDESLAGVLAVVARFPASSAKGAQIIGARPKSPEPDLQYGALTYPQDSPSRAWDRQRFDKCVQTQAPRFELTCGEHGVMTVCDASPHCWPRIGDSGNEGKSLAASHPLVREMGTRFHERSTNSKPRTSG